MIKYIAHRSEDNQRQQTVKEHLEGTARLAEEFADVFGYGDWGYCCGLLHDIGKYSQGFQKRIMEGGAKVDHATAGARECFAKGGYYVSPAYCIAGHHAGLPDTGGSGDTGTAPTFCGRMRKKTEDYQAYKAEIDIPRIQTDFFPVPKTKDPTFSIGFFTRMLYSCLVDADYLDTEAFMLNGKADRKPGEEMKPLWEKFRKHVDKWLANDDGETIDGRRTEILRHCIKCGTDAKGFFRLTCPTGSGKTAASMAFSLRHALEHNMKRIIYVIPYTSIIEQNARVFSDILGCENVLEHHCNVDYESTEELKPMQLATENWDKPVIVTTNVQFFESLYGNKSSQCRKLHNIADSVIVFDEAQMLPNDYLIPCISAIEELVHHYRCSVVLCTATQPALKAFFSENVSITELCPRMEEQFCFFKRTVIQNQGSISEEKLVSMLKQEQQALCILNTKKLVQQVYRQMDGEGVYHLSTLMYPAHRKRVLEKIRERLSSEKRCVVIATSLVEAGVDLDFQTVYRQLAGIDSVIQAAGRCNREGKRPMQESMTYVFQLEDGQKIPGQEQQIDTAQMISRRYDDISGLDAIEEYFTRLYKFRGAGLDKKKIMDEFKKGFFPFAKVGREFKLIEQNTKTVFIAKEEKAETILEKLRYQGMTRHLMREAGQYCVNVYENVFQRLYGTGMLVSVSEDMGDDFFLLRDSNDYTEETGLNVDVESGSDIWF